MRGLSTQELLTVWDQGHGLSPGGRAMLVLATACPEYTRRHLDSFSIGERDALLAYIRARTFGGAVESVAACPACRELVEVSLDIRSIFSDRAQAAPSEETACEPLLIASGDFVVQAAVPAVRDVEAIAAAATPEEGCRMLLRRCVLKAEKRGNPCKVDDLPQEVCALLEERMAEADPEGDVHLSLRCPNCDYRWSTPFDIVTYFWSEIRLAAGRLLRDIHVLASVYGWTESEILTLSTARRFAYLELVGG